MYVDLLANLALITRATRPYLGDIQMQFVQATTSSRVFSFQDFVATYIVSFLTLLSALSRQIDDVYFASPIFVPLSKELSIPLVFEITGHVLLVNSLQNRSPFAVISPLRIRRWNLRTLVRLGPDFWSLVFFYGAGLRHGLLRRALYYRRGCEFAKFLVNRHSIVVKSGRLQDNACSTHQNCQSKDPKKQTVQHHCHVFPILFYLRRETISLI